MGNVNCWEFMKCGREPGGKKTVELGVCPASVDSEASGMNGGRQGGRICWAISGTFCGGLVQGTYAEKQVSCMCCDFFKLVKFEEGKTFKLLKSLDQMSGVRNSTRPAVSPKE